jgi:hypothetical protein
MVYVDDMNLPWRGMIMSHMIADTLEELHDMAERLGVRKHFQDKPGQPHYDICLSNKQRAIKLGAVQITWRQTYLKLKQLENN